MFFVNELEVLNMRILQKVHGQLSLGNYGSFAVHVLVFHSAYFHELLV